MKTQIGDVTYNAVDQCYEALVTFHLGQGRVRVASSFEAPLSAEFDAVSAGLWHAALDALDRPGAMQARLIDTPRCVPPRKPTKLTAIQALTRSISRLAA